jgi:Flp pilus assembly protein TadG
VVFQRLIGQEGGYMKGKAGQAGQAIVETAIVLPLLIMLLLGIIEFGRAVYTANSLNNVARVVARGAAVTPSPLNLPQSAANLSVPTTDLQKLAKSNLFGGLQADKISLLVERIDNSGESITGTVKAGEGVKVTLSWPNFDTMIPYTPNLQSTATMRYERGL